MPTSERQAIDNLMKVASSRTSSEGNTAPTSLEGTESASEHGMETTSEYAFSPDAHKGGKLVVNFPALSSVLSSHPTIASSMVSYETMIDTEDLLWRKILRSGSG